MQKAHDDETPEFAELLDAQFKELKSHTALLEWKGEREALAKYEKTSEIEYDYDAEIDLHGHGSTEAALNGLGNCARSDEARREKDDPCDHRQRNQLEASAFADTLGRSREADPRVQSHRAGPRAG